MRVLPLALWHCGSDAELYADARRQSLVTHGHLRSQLCCAFYVLWARQLLRGDRDGWDAAAEKLLALTRSDVDSAREAKFILAATNLNTACGSGYVLNSLWSARIAMDESNYVAVVRTAVSLGNDTDTTACIAGGLAGIREGFDAIPEVWRRSLRGRGVYQPLLDRLLAGAGA